MVGREAISIKSYVANYSRLRRLWRLRLTCDQRSTNFGVPADAQLAAVTLKTVECVYVFTTVDYCNPGLHVRRCPMIPTNDSSFTRIELEEGTEL